MDIQVTFQAPQATSFEVSEFPMVRFDTGPVVYQEALINGQYLVVNMSAMGRPKPRDWVWRGYHGGASATRPLRTRQHAFQLEIDGQLLVDRWRWVESREEALAQTDSRHKGQRYSVIVLEHQQRPVRVEVHTSLDDTPYLTRWLTITNTGSQPAALAQVFPWSGQVWDVVGSRRLATELSALDGSPVEVGRYVDTMALVEGSFDWVPLPAGSYGFESRHGRSGWGIPFFILKNRVTGENMICHFAWSGNWQVEILNDAEPSRWPVNDAYIYARVGLSGPAPLRVLEAGESATTPAVHLGFCYGDLDRAVQTLHDHIRQSVLLPHPPDRQFLVEVNHTGYTRNAQITEVQLYEEIDVAADVGVELFMLDAGWFGDVSERWFDSVGDWDRESPLLVHGVKAAFERVRERGMLCGLWVEAERMGPASRLLSDHPDWQMTKRGEKIPNLDLSKPEVASYLEETITRLIEKYELDCFRLDYNISVGEGGEAERGGFTENVLWRYYDALYRIFDNIHRRFPNLLLENCSSGGGRMDLGMMARFHWTQITDNWSPNPTLKIMNGTSIALPPEVCMTLLGAISDGVADLDFMTRIGLFGRMCVSGVFPTMAERHMAARQRWQHTINLYKSFARPILADAHIYHHTPIQHHTERGDWVVLENVAADQSRAYAGVFRLAGATGDGYLFRPRGVDLARNYRVTYDSAGSSWHASGHELLNQGLFVPVSAINTSELILFEAI